MSLQSKMWHQAKQPSGFLGHLLGLIFANRASSKKRSNWTVELLELKGDEQVLELGCGPGLALKQAANHLTSGHATGLDHSQTMINHAARRLRPEIDEGRVTCKVGTLADLAPDQQFDRFFMINVAQFLPSLDEAYQQIHDKLSHGGIAVTTYEPRMANPTREEALERAEKITKIMTEVGFSNLEQKELPLEPIPAIAVIGRKKKPD